MITVSVLNSASPIKIAKEELALYLKKMGVDCEKTEVLAEIKLGLFSDFGITPKSSDTLWDDEFLIDIKNCGGIIAGSNARSVLFAVYRFLEENGARWVRPGKNGDYLPQISKIKDVYVREAAAHRYRTVCIEGSASFENLLDMINWLPKLHFNQYFFQFTNVKTFLDRWYSHTFSTVKSPEKQVSDDYAEECTAILKKRTKDLGLTMILGGHCFTNEPFGVEFCGWDRNEDSDMPPEFLNICAQLNGKRGLFLNMVVATQLCYSRPEVRETITDSVVAFLKKHPETDVLSFCLSDGDDNTCECEGCRSKRFTDFYVMMLNDIDRKLSAEGINTKIAHEAYCNLLFPPETERLENPDRFVMMFCPSSRDRTQSWPNEYKVKEIPEYKINNYMANCPYTAEDCLSYLYNWLEVVPTDCFVFDYHLMWDHLLDAGNEAVAKVLYEDIKSFRPLKIQGLISCQLHRNFFPTSIAMTAMGKALWNPDIPYAQIQNQLYSATFGEENADRVIEYMEKLSSCFDMSEIRGLKPCEKEDFAAKMNTAIKTISDFKPFILANQNKTEPCQKTAWGVLIHHAEIYKGVANALLSRIEKQEEKANAQIKEAVHYGFVHEDELQEVFDSYFFCDVISQRLTPKTLSEFSSKRDFNDMFVQTEK